MRHIAAMEADRRAELFQASALQMGLQPMIVEKDFWVYRENEYAVSC